MKIRTNFVSNSSSSSYIISCKGQKLAEYVKEAEKERKEEKDAKA